MDVSTSNQVIDQYDVEEPAEVAAEQGPSHKRVVYRLIFYADGRVEKWMRQAGQSVETHGVRVPPSDKEKAEATAKATSYRQVNPPTRPKTEAEQRKDEADADLAEANARKAITPAKPELIRRERTNAPGAGTEAYDAVGAEFVTKGQFDADRQMEQDRRQREMDREGRIKAAQEKADKEDERLRQYARDAVANRKWNSEQALRWYQEQRQAVDQDLSIDLHNSSQALSTRNTNLNTTKDLAGSLFREAVDEQRRQRTPQEEEYMRWHVDAMGNRGTPTGPPPVIGDRKPVDVNAILDQSFNVVLSRITGDPRLAPPSPVAKPKRPDMPQQPMMPEDPEAIRRIIEEAERQQSFRTPAMTAI